MQNTTLRKNISYFAWNWDVTYLPDRKLNQYLEIPLVTRVSRRNTMYLTFIWAPCSTPSLLWPLVGIAWRNVCVSLHAPLLKTRRDWPLNRPKVKALSWKHPSHLNWKSEENRVFIQAIDSSWYDTLFIKFGSLSSSQYFQNTAAQCSLNYSITYS